MLKKLLILIFLYSNYTLSDTDNFVNLYSARQSVLMKPLINAFQKKTDIKVNIIAAKASQLINRIEAEGKYTKADVLLTTDVGRLIYAKNKKLFKAVDSTYLKKVIPNKFKDKDNQWFGLSLRSRIFIYNKNKVKKEELFGYIDLAHKRWKKRVMVRSSNNVYNQSLVSAMILNYGEKRVNSFLKNFVNNFSRKPSGGDRDQIRGVVSGEGDIALVNSYYYFKMKFNDKENFLKDINLHFPRDNSMKTHVNISGAGIIKFSKNYGNAVKFLEYMVSNEAQKIYADINYEYPISNNLNISTELKKYKIPEQDALRLEKIGIVNKKATILMDRAGWK